MDEQKEILLIYNEEDQSFEEYEEPYATIDCPTEEDYNRFKELVKLGNRMQWISVKDRLPKPREDVLVCVYWHEKYQTRPGWYSEQDGLWYVDISAHWKWDLNVTHWMPLPEPPKEL